MEQSSWLVQLQEAVAQKAEQIESREMPRLKELCGIYQTYFESVYNILIKKSLIQADPYKYDEKISEVISGLNLKDTVIIEDNTSLLKRIKTGTNPFMPSRRR